MWQFKKWNIDSDMWHFIFMISFDREILKLYMGVRLRETYFKGNDHFGRKNMSALWNVRFIIVRFIETIMRNPIGNHPFPTKVSDSRRCPLYGVTVIERFHCIYLSSFYNWWSLTHVNLRRFNASLYSDGNCIKIQHPDENVSNSNLWID